MYNYKFFIKKILANNYFNIISKVRGLVWCLSLITLLLMFLIYGSLGLIEYLGYNDKSK
jgi:hypothetical protein